VRTRPSRPATAHVDTEEEQAVVWESACPACYALDGTCVVGCLPG
jgi:hypothetical protein